MRVQIDQDRCMGHAMCNLAAPQVFGLSDEDGHGYVLLDEVPPELEAAARRGAEGCPEEAITILDD